MCPSPSFDFPRLFRRLLSIPSGTHLWIFAAVKCLAVFRAPEEHRKPTPVLHPRLPIIRPSTRSRQRKFRIIQVLALLYYHLFGQEPSGPSSSFRYGHGDGASQAPGGIDTHLGGGGDITSGQGPGLELSLLEEFLNSTDVPGQGPELSTQEVEELWNSIITLQLPGQGPDISSSRPANHLTTRSSHQQSDCAPRPPVPLGEYTAGPSTGPAAGSFVKNLAEHSDGYSAAYSKGRSEGHAEGFAEGLAHARAAMERSIKSAFYSLTNQKALMQGALNHSCLLPVTLMNHSFHGLRSTHKF